MRFLTIVALALGLVVLDVSANAAPGVLDRKPKRTSKKRVVKKAAPAKVTRKVDPLNQPVVGTWYLLDSERKFVKMTKIVLTKYGEFTFIGSAWKSGGTYSYRNNELKLSWTSVDGKAVQPGTMKKTLPVFENGKLIQLDRFQYGKSA